MVNSTCPLFEDILVLEHGKQDSNLYWYTGIYCFWGQDFESDQNWKKRKLIGLVRLHFLNWIEFTRIFSHYAFFVLPKEPNYLSKSPTSTTQSHTPSSSRLSFSLPLKLSTWISMSFLFSLQSRRMFFPRPQPTTSSSLSSFSHFLNFSSPLFGPIIWVFGWGFSSVGWISGLSEMVLLQGAGSCPTHSTAYQPHIQLSMKEGWKDRGIIGRSERDQASEGQRMERCSDRE